MKTQASDIFTGNPSMNGRGLVKLKCETMELTDGLEKLQQVISLKEIASMIERTAMWVSPDTFRLLPVWFPEYSRGSLFYKENWSKKQTNTDRVTGQSIHKSEANTHASTALTLALGLRSKQRPNWSCCHIWGIDDPKFQLSNIVVRDNRFFSCVANMVLLPTPLKAFTDAWPEIKVMLRVCAKNLYEWECDHEALRSAHREVKNWNNWDAYPASWPKCPKERRPTGTIELSPLIRESAEKRLSDIRRDLREAGPFYPQKQVLDALKYWKIASQIK